jgi:hypothetical protein
MTQVIIYPKPDNKVAVVSWPQDGRTAQSVADRIVPEGTSYQIKSKESLPSFTFIDAWVYGENVTVDIETAKEIAHHHRRVARAEEFVEYDEIVSKQIPGEVEGAEAQRALIRTKYAAKQTEIDACTTVDQLESVIRGLKQA